MKLKKVIAGTLMLNLLTFSPLLASADTTDSKIVTLDKLPQKIQYCLDDLRDALPELKKLRFQHASSGLFRNNKNTYWTVYFATGDPSKKLSATASILIEEKTGDVFGYTYRNYDWDSPAPPTADTAKKAASAFSDVLLTGLYQMADEVIAGEPGTRTENLLGVKLYQKVNGIPLLNGWSTIWVDQKGTVVSYEKNDIKMPKEDAFPNRNKVVTPSVAKAAFAKEVELLPANKNGEYAYKVMYKNAIDAVSGVATTADPQQYLFNGVQSITTEAKPMTVGSTAEALKLLQTSFGLEPETIKLNESVEMDGTESVKVYTWGPAATTDVRWAEVRTVPSTGMVKSVTLRRHQASTPSAGATGNEDIALQSAIGLAKQYLPADVQSVSVLKRKASDTESEINLQPISNGVVLNDGGSFRIIANKFTGKIFQFEYEPVDKPITTTPEIKNAVPLKTAKETYLNQVKLDLYYVLPQDDKESPKLIYLPAVQTQTTYIHPTTGALTTEQDDS